jgi:hypothetical protein
MTILRFYVSLLLKDPLGFSYRGRVSVLDAEYSSWNVVRTMSLDEVKQPFAFFFFFFFFLLLLLLLLLFWGRRYPAECTAA